MYLSPAPLAVPLVVLTLASADEGVRTLDTLPADRVEKA